MDLDTLYTRAVFVGKRMEGDQEVYSFKATTDVVDRHGEIVTLDGWEFDDWNKNPVVLDCHNYGSIVEIVGKGARPLYLEEGAWIVDVVFSKTNPKGIIAKGLVDEGMLNAVSVGFQSKERTYGNDGEPMKHTRKALLEISTVPIPGNQDALRVRTINGLVYGTSEANAVQLIQMAAHVEADLKAGRVLSAKNEKLIRAAAEGLQSVLSSLGSTDGEDQSASGKAADAAEPVLAVDVDLSALRAFAGQ